MPPVPGILICGGGLYCLVKEKDDRESRKIYGIAAAIGAAIAIGFLIRLLLQPL